MRWRTFEIWRLQTRLHSTTPAPRRCCPLAPLTAGCLRPSQTALPRTFLPPACSAAQRAILTHTRCTSTLPRAWLTFRRRGFSRLHRRRTALVLQRHRQWCPVATAPPPPPAAAAVREVAVLRAAEAGLHRTSPICLIAGFVDSRGELQRVFESVLPPPRCISAVSSRRFPPLPRPLLKSLVLRV